MVRVRCRSCGYEFDCDPTKDPSCICPRCGAINPIKSPSAQLAPPTRPPIKSPPSPSTPPPQILPQPSPSLASTVKYVTVYAILKDESRVEVTKVAEGGPEVVLGRGELSRFAWRDPDTISRVHVKVKFDNGKIYVRDDGSTNGTYVDNNDIRGKGDVEIPPGKEVILVNPHSPVVKLAFEVR